MNKPFEHTLENMMIDLAETPLGNMEYDMEREIEKTTTEKRNQILSMISEENNLKADDALGDIEYFCKTRAYACGFRRAMHIMFDTFFGGENCEQD